LLQIAVALSKLWRIITGLSAAAAAERLRGKADAVALTQRPGDDEIALGDDLARYHQPTNQLSKNF